MDVPDMSHLTEEERKHILQVVNRLKAEEEKEKAMTKTFNAQFQNYKNQVQQACGTTPDESKVSTDTAKDSGQVCSLCNKTKIAEGCGHTCAYCTKILCTRCGGRVTLKSKQNEKMNMWVCNVCRKQQEMLINTGSLIRNGKNQSSLTLSLEPLSQNENIKMSTSASLAQLGHNKRSKTGLLVASSLKKGVSVPQLDLENNFTSPEARLKENSAVIDTYLNNTTSIGESSEISRVTKQVKPHTPGTEENSPPIQNGTSNGSSPTVTLGIRRSSTNSERRLHRQELAIVSNENVSSSSQSSNLLHDNISNSKSKKMTPGVECRFDDHEADKSCRPMLNSYQNSSLIPSDSLLRTPNSSQSLSGFSPELRIKKPSALPVDDTSVQHFYPGSDEKHLKENYDLRDDKHRHDANDDKRTLNFNHDKHRYEGKKEIRNYDLNDDRKSFSPGGDRNMFNCNESDDKKRYHPYDAKQQFGVSDDVTSIRSRDQALNEVFVQPTPNHEANYKQFDDTDYHHNNHHLPQKGSSSNQPSSSRSVQDLPSHHHHRFPSSRRENCSLSFSHQHHTSNPHKTLRHQHPSRQRDTSQPRHVEEQGDNEKSSELCRRHKHRRGYLSDNEGSVYAPDHRMTPSSRRPKRNSRSPLPYREDNSSGLRSGYVTLADASKHCHAAGSSRTCGRFRSTDNLNTPYQRGSDVNFHHSDVNLSRVSFGPSRGHSSYEVVRSCGQGPNSKRMDHSPHYNHVYGPVTAHRKFKAKTAKHFRRKPSLSSTDEDVRSTPDCSSCEEIDRNSNHSALRRIKDDQSLVSIASPWHGDLNEDAFLDYTTYDNTFGSPRNKHNFHSPSDVIGPPSNYNLRDGLTTSHKRDSGIDTGSSANTIHSEDVAREQCQVSWHLSRDGKSLIGRMVLNKSATNLHGVTAGSVLGVKVVGGKQTENGYLGAFVTRVKKGSIADKVGRLEPGDEVIMWNDHELRGASSDRVCDIISASRDEKLVPLIVCRAFKNDRRASDRHVVESSSSSFDSQKREDENTVTRYSSQPHLSQQSLDGAHLQADRFDDERISGKIQIRLMHDNSSNQLSVTVVQATDLLPRRDGLMRTSYVKLYLLPDRSDQSKRRTKTVKRTLNPMWQQTFTYSNFKRQDMKSMSLEISLWDLDRSYQTNSHFMGRVLIDLNGLNMDNAPQWYKLMGPDPLTTGVLNTHKQLGLQSVQRNAPSLSRPFPTNSCLSPNHRVPSASRVPISQSSELSGVPSNFRSLSNDETLLLRDQEQSRDSHTSSNLRYDTQSDDRRSHTSLPSSSLHQYPDQHFPSTSKLTDQPRRKTGTREQLPLSEQDPGHPKQIHPILRKERFSDTTSATETDCKSTPRTSYESSVPPNHTSSVINISEKLDEKITKSSSPGCNLQTQHTSRVSSQRHGKSRPHSNKSTPPNRRHNFGNKITSLVGMKNRSQSSNTLEGSGKCNRSARSAEFGLQPDFQKDGNRSSATGSLASLGSEGSTACEENIFHSFIGKLGPGQVVGRQTPVFSPLGEIEMSLHDRQGYLDVHIIKARNLSPKLTSKLEPATTVKVYLVFGGRLVSKKKTKAAPRSLSPSFDQIITFEPNHYGDSLQISVRGDYGLMDQKVFMGMIQIRLEGLDLSSKLTGWYTLYSRASLAEPSSLSALKVTSTLGT